MRARHAVEQCATLSYDPAAAAFLDRIQASALALSDGELSAPGRNGFVVSTRHVLSEVVHDRVPSRWMPSPLDAAFAALGNDQALVYNDDLERFPALPGALTRMRMLVDAHDAAF